MCECFLECMHTVCVWCSQRWEDGFTFPWTRLTDVCYLPCEYWQLNPNPLQEQLLLSTKISLQFQWLGFSQLGWLENNKNRRWMSWGDGSVEMFNVCEDKRTWIQISIIHVKVSSGQITWVWLCIGRYISNHWPAGLGKMVKFRFSERYW